jgi:flavin reductase
MLLVCIRSRSPIVEAIAVNSALAVNTLAHDQLSVADTFAGRAHGCAPYDFGCADWETDARKPPLLVGAASRFSCAPSRTVAAGSHTIVIARVLHADTTSAAALAYTGSDYVRTERAAA